MLRGRLLTRILIAVVLGVAFPYAELAWKCREAAADSEACVWGRAYFPMSRWVEPIIVTPIAFVVLWVAARVLRPKVPDHSR